MGVIKKEGSQAASSVAAPAAKAEGATTKQNTDTDTDTQTHRHTGRQTDTQHTSSSKQAVDKIFKIIKNSLFFSLGLSLITINLAEMKLS